LAEKRKKNVGVRLVYGSADNWRTYFAAGCFRQKMRKKMPFFAE
jgi:hypothetical protein